MRQDILDQSSEVAIPGMSGNDKIAENFYTTSTSGECTVDQLSSIKLMRADSTEYTGPIISSFKMAPLQLEYDTADLGSSDKVYIEVSNGVTTAKSNSFQFQVVCPKITMKPLGDVNEVVGPTTTSVITIFEAVDLSDYDPAYTNCPVTYTWLQNGVETSLAKITIETDASVTLKLNPQTETGLRMRIKQGALLYDSPDQITIQVKCGLLTKKQEIESRTYEIPAQVTKQGFTILFASLSSYINNPSNEQDCPLLFWLQKDGNNFSEPGKLSLVGDQILVNVHIRQLQENMYAEVWQGQDGSNEVGFGPFTVNVVCAYPNIEPVPQVYEYTLNTGPIDIQIPVLFKTRSDPSVCSFEDYVLLKDGVPFTDTSDIEYIHPTLKVKAIAVKTIQKLQFQTFFANSPTSSFIHKHVSYPFRIVISPPVCTLQTTSITSTTSPSFSSFQLVPKQSPSSFFSLPTYQSSNSLCPITSYLTSFSLTSTANDLLTLQNPQKQEDGTYVVRPVDFSKDLYVEFYVVVEVNQDVRLWSQRFRLSVGCTKEVVEVSEQVEKVTERVVAVNSTSGVDYVVLEHTVTPGWCKVQVYKVHSVTVDGVVNENAIRYPDPCENDCNFVVRDKSKPAEIKFKILVVVNGMSYQMGTEITLKVQCTKEQVQIVAEGLKSGMELKMAQFEVGAVLAFKPAQCFPLECCSTNFIYKAVDSTSPLSLSLLSSQPILDTNPFSPTFSNLISQLVTTTLISSSFFIQITEQKFNFQHVSSPIRVTISYNCLFDRATSKANTGSLPKSVAYNGGAMPAAYLIKEAVEVGSSFTAVALDLSDMITNNASQQCPLSEYKLKQTKNYKLDQIVQNSNVKVTGIMVGVAGIVANTTLDVYVQVFNGRVWMEINQALLRIDVVFKPELSSEAKKDKLPINMTDPIENPKTNSTENNLKPASVTPKFKDDELKPRYDLDLTDKNNSSTNKIIEFKLPTIVGPADWNLRIQNPKPFVLFDQASKSLMINTTMVTKDDLGPLKLTLLLSYPSSVDQSSYDFNFWLTMKEQLKQPEAVIPKVVLEFLQLWNPTSVKNESHSKSPKAEFKVSEPELRVPRNVTGFIKQIDIFGEMVVQFNSTMFSNYSYSLMNSSVLDIYIDPYEHPQNLSTLKFTWQLDSVQDNLMRFKLNFTHPEAISPEAEQDTLVMHLLDPNSFMFFSIDELTFVHHSCRTMRKKITKQMTKSDIVQMAFDSGDKVEDIMKAGLIFAFLYAAALGQNESFKYFLWYIRALQLVIHLPMLQIIVPANVSRFYRSLVPVVQLNILNPTWTTDLLFEFDDDTQRELQKETLDQMIDIGYQTHNAIQNLGSLWVFMVLYFAKVIVYLLYRMIKSISRGKIQSTWLDKLKRQLFFKEILSLIIDGYIEWMASGLLNQMHFVTTKSGETAGNVTSFFCLFFSFILVPCSLLWIIFRPFARQYQKAFLRKFGFFFEDISTHSKFQSLYFVFFVIRRIIFIFVVFFFTLNGYVQLMFLLLTNLMISIYIGSKPFMGKLLNRLAVMEEVFIQLLYCHMMFFTDWVPSKTTQSIFGWSMISILAVHLALELLILAKNLSRTTRLLLQREYRRLRKFLERRRRIKMDLVDLNEEKEGRKRRKGRKKRRLKKKQEKELGDTQQKLVDCTAAQDPEPTQIDIKDQLEDDPHLEKKELILQENPHQIQKSYTKISKKKMKKKKKVRFHDSLVMDGINIEERRLAVGKSERIFNQPTIPDPAIQTRLLVINYDSSELNNHGQFVNHKQQNSKVVLDLRNGAQINRMSVKSRGINRVVEEEKESFRSIRQSTESWNTQMANIDDNQCCSSKQSQTLNYEIPNTQLTRVKTKRK